MITLLETIKIVDGNARFLAYHQARLHDSRKKLFRCSDRLDLATLIQPPSMSGNYRCRVIYAREVHTIEYHPLIERSFSCFRVLSADALCYPFKYVNRDAINRLWSQRGLAEDILIIKNGRVTDTSIANVAFWQGTRWVTPAVPLLNGTTRQRLLDEHKIYPEIIHLNDLIHFKKMALMNALIGFYVIENFKLIF